MDDNAAEEPGTWLENLVEGGLPQVVLGKHVSKALGRLISGVTDIPVAALDNISQRIRDDTKARSQVKAALAKAAASYAKGQPPIVQRAAERWAGETARKQENVEAIAVNTIEHLKLDPPKEEPTSGPSDDFMNRFSKYAEDASSDELRDLFGRVLAGEIRKPGSVSLATLQLVAVMDQPLAQTIRSSKAWIANSEFIVSTAEMNEGEKFEVVNQLIDNGLCRSGQISRRVSLTTGPIALEYHKRVLLVEGETNATLKYRIIPLTRVGREVFALLPDQADEAIIRTAAQYLKTVPFVRRVQIADLVSLNGDYVEAKNFEEI